MRKELKLLVTGAMIAAMYTALTLAVPALAFGPLQFRISEALTILPIFTTAAIPGLAVGCAISNAVGLMMGANIAGVWDILFGTLATLLAAAMTYWLRNVRVKNIPFLAFLPPVILNGLVIGAELAITLHLPMAITMLQVAGEQVLACIGLGLPLFLVLRKSGIEKRIFGL